MGDKLIMKHTAIILLLLLLPACTTDGTQRSKWDYYSPENTKCPDSHIAVCRKYGPHMICECRQRTKHV